MTNSNCGGRGLAWAATAVLTGLAVLSWAVHAGAAIVPSTSDLWDISQGSVVTATSGAYATYSDIRDMFGGTFSEVEPGHTIFSDGRPAGFVHYVEWKTAAPVTISSFNLFASGDPAYDNEREFAQFVLKARSSPSATNFDLTLYTLVVTNHPYTFVDPVNFCLLSTAIAPVTAQYFRAEFTQYNAGRGYDGPRIVELDGFGGNPPVVVSGPTNVETLTGGSATFSVVATGSAPLAYQWHENMTNIPASVNPTATNATLVLTNINVGQSGDVYSVMITNLEGSTNSSNAVLTVLAPGSCFPAPPGIVSWWPGERSAIDIAGTNNGTLATGLTFAPGEVGQAFQFNGGTGYVSVAPSATLDVGQGQGLTIEAWINPADLVNRHPIVEWNSNWNDGQFGLGVHFWTSQNPPYGPGAGCLYANLMDTAGTGHYFASAGGILAGNTFQHVALTYDKTSGLGTIYLNGAVVAQQNLGVFTPQTSYPLYFGDRPSGDGAGTFVGEIDEISLYSRALSSNEIQAIYQAGSAGKCDSFPPVITSEPQSETLYGGSTASFSVGAGGSQPLSYQWQENTTNIPASVNPTATNTTLVLTNINVGQSGNVYSVLVSNPEGSTNSSNAVLTVLAPGSCFPAPAGIVSWWPGERSAIDIAGTNNGTLATGLRFAAGEVGQAFNFNGTSGYVSIPASASMAQVGQGSGLTIEAWINPTDQNLRPVAEWNSGSAYGAVFWINQPPPFGTGTGSIYANVVDTSGQGHDVVTPPGLVVTNTFQHIALTYDRASGVGTIYYNGVQVGQQNIGSVAVQTSFPFYLGYRPWGVDAGTTFAGRMDEVSLYNRALSPAEIQFIYNAGSAGKCSEPEISVQPLSQVGYWGNTTTLSVAVAGSGPFTYQWDYNGAAIGGATNSTLVLGDLQFTNDGAYTVTVSNPFGSQTSAPAYLTVNPAGVSIAAYPGLTIAGGIGQTYGIQYSTDLSDTNTWVGITNLTLATTNVIWYDSQPLTLPRRYYRVLPGPIPIP